MSSYKDQSRDWRQEEKYIWNSDTSFALTKIQIYINSSAENLPL